MLRCYKLYSEEKGLGEAQIPVGIKAVECEILKEGTPVPLCRLLAGEHQQLQSQAVPVSSSEALGLLQLTCLEKLRRTKKTPFLSDEEVYAVTQQLGIVYASKKAEAKEKTDKQKVCYDF